MPITMLQHRDPAPLANRPVEWLAPLARWLMGVVSALLVSCAHADDTGGGGSTPRTQTLHWMGTTDDNEVRWRTGIRWSERLRFGDLPVRNDMAVIYQQWIADDVRAQGLGMTRVSSYTDDYRQTISRCLAERVPNVNFDGYILIDIEFMPLIWGKRTGGPDLYEEADHGPRQFDTWYTYIRNNRPEVTQNLGTEAAEHALAETYEQAVREWLTLTFHLFRELRPNAKLSYYGMPMGSRHWQYNTPDPNIWKQRNDRLSWLVTLQDAQMIPLYQDRITVPEGTTPRGQWQNTIAQSEDWIISNLREARRIGQGKPVLVLAMVKYMEYIPGYELAFLQPINLDHMLRLPLVHGADGLIFWDHIENQTQFNELQSFIDQSVVPLLLPMFQTGGGSGGGGDTGGGSGGGGDTGGGSGGGGDTGGGSGGGGDTGGGSGGGGDTGGGSGGGGDTGGGSGGGGDTGGGSGGGGDTGGGSGGGGDTGGGSGGGGDTGGGSGDGGDTGGGSSGGGDTGGGSGDGGDTGGGSGGGGDTGGGSGGGGDTGGGSGGGGDTGGGSGGGGDTGGGSGGGGDTGGGSGGGGDTGGGSGAGSSGAGGGSGGGTQDGGSGDGSGGGSNIEEGPRPPTPAEQVAAARARMGIVVRNAAPSQNLPRNRVTVSRIARPNQHLSRLNTGQTVRSPGLRVMERNNLIRVLPRTSSGTRP
ncbi:MAG: hypothetical protein KF859_14205 [Phycisphaeraceae bacterium]|nr:hypothetical protein [Phycisphaeraceae bacterium]